MRPFLLLYISLQLIGTHCNSAVSGTDRLPAARTQYADTVQVYGMLASFHSARPGDDSLHVSFSASLPAATAALPDEALTFTPVLSHAGHRVALPPIVVNGHIQKNYYPRTRALDYARRVPSPYTVINCSASTRRQRVTDTIRIDYLHHLPLASWMAHASLWLVASGHKGRERYPSDSVSLCDDLRLSARSQADTVYVYRDTCHQRVVIAQPDTVPLADGPLTFRLWFRQGQRQSIPMLYGNDKELARMRLLADGLGRRLTRVTIHSCSSPEGTYYRNRQLTRARGLMVKRHLHGMLPGLSPDRVEVSESPENWEELVRLLQKSDKPYRDQALRIIRDVPIFSSRETRLMELQRGDPYRDMLSGYFPMLRYVDVTFVCDDDKQNTESYEVEPVQSPRP